MLMKNALRMVILQNMKIVICDDEPVFADILEQRLRNYAALKDIQIDLLKVYSSRILLQTELSGCDVLFLDIDMPEINGVEVAKRLRHKYATLILVFVTGWIEYAPAGYRVNAFRYLLKKNLRDELNSCMDDIREKLLESAEVVTLHTRDRTLEIGIKSMQYFEGTSRRTVLLHLCNHEPPVECVGKLSDYETQMSEKGFIRIQKSFLVNMEHIVKIRNYMAVLKDGTELKVSERQYATVKKQFLMWKGKIL